MCLGGSFGMAFSWGGHSFGGSGAVPSPSFFCISSNFRLSSSTLGAAPAGAWLELLGWPAPLARAWPDTFLSSFSSFTTFGPVLYFGNGGEGALYLLGPLVVHFSCGALLAASLRAFSSASCLSFSAAC
jgi:hypothetical protein